MLFRILLGLLFAGSAFAQDYPNRPVKIIVPYAPGGSTDIIGRIVAELIAQARRDPGRINSASAGLGSYPHLDMEKLKQAAGIEMTHVPYKGGAGQMIPSLIAGETQVAFLNLASTLPHIRAGRMKALATAMPSRLAELPEVPTLAELGFAG